MKPKLNRKGTPQLDNCQTPGYAVLPLISYLYSFDTVWEPACGEGYLSDYIVENGLRVVASDILTGHDFFERRPPAWDCIVTNPPYSLKYKWLERCYSFDKPFALLLPVETLGAAKAQKLFSEYGISIILLNKRVNFKMPNKGWEGSGAQFPVAWFCYKMPGLERDKITYGYIDKQAH